VEIVRAPSPHGDCKVFSDAEVQNLNAWKEEALLVGYTDKVSVKAILKLLRADLGIGQYLDTYIILSSGNCLVASLTHNDTVDITRLK
jgi:hypothetical protein